MVVMVKKKKITNGKCWYVILLYNVGAMSIVIGQEPTVPISNHLHDINSFPTDNLFLLTSFITYNGGSLSRYA